jgi:hypothetical protein
MDMNGQAQFIADLVGLYNEWAAVEENPIATYIHKKAGESKTCPEENFRIFLGPVKNRGYDFFENIGIPTPNDKKGRLGKVGEPGYQELLIIECKYIEALSEDQKQEITQKAKHQIEVLKMHTYLCQVDPLNVLKSRILRDAKNRSCVFLRPGHFGAAIFSAIDASLDKMGMLCQRDKKITFDEYGNPKAYSYDFVPSNSRMVERLLKDIEPLLNEISVIRLMKEIVQEYNQAARYIMGRESMAYELHEKSEAEGTMPKKYFLLQAKKEAVTFLEQLGISVFITASGESIIDYAEIEEMLKKNGTSILHEARKKAMEIKGNERGQLAELTFNVVTTGLVAGGSGGAAAGGAGNAAFEGPH